MAALWKESSKKVKYCRRFEKNVRQLKKNEIVKIVYKKRGRKKYATNCYASSSEHGWCGTCRAGAKKGEDGYCLFLDRPFSKQPDVDKLPVSSKVFASRSWGFCHKNCQSGNFNAVAKQLHEIHQSVLSREHCKLFTKEIPKKLRYESKIEICAGHKSPYPTVQVYEMTSSLKFNFKKNVTSS